MRNVVNWLLIAAGGALVIAELILGAATGFDLLLTGVALAAGGVIGLTFGSAPIGLLASGVMAIVYYVFLRRWLRSKLVTQHQPSNVDAIVGRIGVVTMRLAEHAPGQVKVGDEVWRAVLAQGAGGPREPGQTVKVESVDGVTLQVR